MKVLIYCSHPAQFLFYKFIIYDLKEKKHEIKLLIKSKDVLEDLVNKEGFEYENILAEGRKNGKRGILIGLFKRIIRINKIIRKFKPDLLLGTDASIAQLAWFYGKPGIIILEDDAQVIRNLAKLAYPFARHIITPQVCSVGKWNNKKIGYESYMKLAYLHPKYFNPTEEMIQNVKKPYFLIRLSQLNAYHDYGIQGINFNTLDKIIKMLENHGSVYISSEKALPEKYSQYCLKTEAQNIHHYLNYANLLICDSQSMAMEAAMLGTPSIRYSGFIGKISVLEELEHKYDLTYGILPSKPEKLFDITSKLLNIQDLKQEFVKRKNKMLKDKIDITSFMVWFIDNYPKSFQIMEKDPDQQYNFK